MKNNVSNKIVREISSSLGISITKAFRALAVTLNADKRLVDKIKTGKNSINSVYNRITEKDEAKQNKIIKFQVCIEDDIIYLKDEERDIHLRVASFNTKEFKFLYEYNFRNLYKKFIKMTLSLAKKFFERVSVKGKEKRNE